jgi:hypothetical protein
MINGKVHPDGPISTVNGRETVNSYKNAPEKTNKKGRAPLCLCSAKSWKHAKLTNSSESTYPSDSSWAQKGQEAKAIDMDQVAHIHQIFTLRGLTVCLLFAFFNHSGKPVNQNILFHVRWHLATSNNWIISSTTEVRRSRQQQITL